jgi:uncharacterized protein with HEPN domain
MRLDDRTRLQHMIEAAESIATFISGRTRADLDTDRMLLFAVVRAIEILGEAASQISDDIRSHAADVPWRAMVGMRNRIVHAYFDIGPGHRVENGCRGGARLAAAAARAARTGEKRRNLVTEDKRALESGGEAAATEFVSALGCAGRRRARAGLLALHPLRAQAARRRGALVQRAGAELAGDQPVGAARPAQETLF